MKLKALIACLLSRISLILTDLILGGLVFCFYQQSFAANEIQPYIDQLKIEKKTEEPSFFKKGQESYIDSVRRGMKQKNQVTESSYIEELKKSDSSLKSEKSEKEKKSYLEIEKEKLNPEVKGGAIQEVLEGHSELHAKIEGSIHHAFGLKYGVSLSRNISSSAQLLKFNDIYGENYAPDLSLFYEFQPFHSEWFGNVGLMGMVGASYFHGQGIFAKTLEIPGSGGQDFPSNSNTKFKFISVPVILGLDYRFNLLRILRPYVMAGVTSVGYIESRDDDIAGSRGHTEGFLVALGVAVLLDGLSSKSSWQFYSSFGIQHAYLTVDYTRLSTYTGSINYRVSGIMAGLMFEY